MDEYSGDGWFGCFGVGVCQFGECGWWMIW